MHFEQGKLMRVNYNPALVGLVQQVRQISVMGYNVPMHIQDAAELAKQFMKQARALQQASDIFLYFLLISAFVLGLNLHQQSKDEGSTVSDELCLANR